MALYDANNPQSCGLPTAEQLGLRLSECLAFQNLCEVATPAEALKYISIGPDDKGVPLSGEAWTRDQLDQRHFRALLLPSTLTGARSVRGRQRNQRLLSWDWMIDIKRQIRKEELGDSLNDVWSFFTDRLFAIEETQLAAAADAVGKPWVGPVNLLEGPWRNDFGEEGGQGDFYWAHIGVTLGRGGSG